MNSQRKSVIDQLNSTGVQYEIVEHKAAHTVEEMSGLMIKNESEIAKNLFLRDDKKMRYILLVLQKEKQVNLRELAKKINSRPLSFASEESLQRFLGLPKGSVTPLGILNDESRKVEVMIDTALLSYHRIGVHPNDNTATIFLKLSDLENIINDHGNKLEYLEV